MTDEQKVAVKKFLYSIKAAVMTMDIDSMSNSAIQEVYGNIKELVNNGVDFDDLTPEQQMEIRKNLGLYYEETSVGEKTVSYDGQQQEQMAPGKYKISNDTPSIEDIIKVLDEGNEVSTQITWLLENRVYQISDSATNDALFQILLADIPGQTTGIYCTDNSKTMQLVYKGEETTISKIDAKFLPEQKGGMPVITVKKQISINDAGTININDYFSEEDLEILKNCGTCYGKVTVPSNNGIIGYLIMTNYIGSMGFLTLYIYQGMSMGSSFLAFITGSTSSNFTLHKPSDSTQFCTITQLPTSQMTSEELDEIGFNNSFIQLIKNFKINKIVLEQDIPGMPPSLKDTTNWFSVIAANNTANGYVVEFWSTDNIYKIYHNNSTQEYHCTVTPR